MSNSKPTNPASPASPFSPQHHPVRLDPSRPLITLLVETWYHYVIELEADEETTPAQDVADFAVALAVMAKGAGVSDISGLISALNKPELDALISAKSTELITGLAELSKLHAAANTTDPITTH